MDVKDSPGSHVPASVRSAMRRRIKGMLMAGKQYSLDSHMDLVQTMVQNTQNENMPTMRENSPEQQEFNDNRNENTYETGVQTENGVNNTHRGRSKSVDDT